MRPCKRFILYVSSLLFTFSLTLSAVESEPEESATESESEESAEEEDWDNFASSYTNTQEAFLDAIIGEEVALVRYALRQADNPQSPLRVIRSTLRQYAATYLENSVGESEEITRLLLNFGAGDYPLQIPDPMEIMIPHWNTVGSRHPCG